MKAKVLHCCYGDRSGYEIVRVYFEKDLEQATKDYKMMCEFASDCRTWKLEDVEVFGDWPLNALQHPNKLSD
jgi:hypothetical protein